MMVMFWNGVQVYCGLCIVSVVTMLAIFCIVHLIKEMKKL